MRPEIKYAITSCARSDSSPVSAILAAKRGTFHLEYRIIKPGHFFVSIYTADIAAHQLRRREAANLSLFLPKFSGKQVLY